MNIAHLPAVTNAVVTGKFARSKSFSISACSFWSEMVRGRVDGNLLIVWKSFCGVTAGHFALARSYCLVWCDYSDLGCLVTLRYLLQCELNCLANLNLVSFSFFDVGYYSAGGTQTESGTGGICGVAISLTHCGRCSRHFNSWSVLFRVRYLPPREANARSCPLSIMS
jgi:hypothetical protein